MIELPESYTISAQINKYLVGKFISYIELLKTPHGFCFLRGDKEKYAGYLEGQEIVSAEYHGGMIQINTLDSTILLFDGAYPKYYDDKRKFPKKHQLALYFEDETALFVSIQMYGGIFVFPKGTCDNSYYRLACQKPSPLTEEFTLEYFKDLYFELKKKTSAKAFLATEQRIPGLGNGVLQDILWDAGIDPRCVVTEDNLESLYASTKKVLTKMVEDGGRDTERSLFGEKGGYITQLSKKTLYQPCMKCGHEIHKASYMGGTVYFCDQCQRR